MRPTADDTDHDGLAVGAATRLPSGTVHPNLARPMPIARLARRPNLAAVQP